MNVELGSDLIARQLVQRLDPRAEGAFIEVGLGNIHFSFSWAAPLGFRCHAVEALPSDKLKAACAEHRVNLVAAAMAERRGEVPIYVGEFNGAALSDVSSLNPRWWGSGKHAKLVPSLAPADLFNDHQITRATLFKVDTEGSERMILQGLAKLPPGRLPAVVLFEYGGGATKASRQGGWTEEFFAGTLGCLTALKELGYAGGLLIEEALPEPRPFDLQRTTDFAGLFPDDAFVGNAVVTRAPLDAATVEEINRAIAPELAAEARRAAARRRREKLNHYTTRVVEGIKRRLLPSKKS